ncbi:dual specificity phosphatase, catalytic domain protein [Onchocerca flexuosa]|uniref:Dual specificity phosphatase, catalytic domain protein n=1 Tax=Onchocerca flexuosa TaxID=387005 RepID=A0A238BHU7_9BILA|nr:dual specificity phosphatase, catalytic domain protein [Onchocerca flexuosa]
MVTPKLCDISEVRPYLYLSGFGCVTEKKLRSLGITHIIDATNLPNNPHYEGIEFLDILVDDSLIANLTPHFASAAQFIQDAQKKNGKTLIYCAAGISRSSSLCIMSLVLNEGLSLREAYYDVLDKRPFISPNVAFWRQMIEYECKERGKSTVELLRGMARPIPDVYVKKLKSNAVAVMNRTERMS